MINDKQESMASTAERPVVLDRPQPVPARSEPLTPMELLARAVEGGATVEVLSGLMDLQERWQASQERLQASQAVRNFETAMAAAQGEMPLLVKNRLVDFEGPRGRVKYRHEDLSEVVSAIQPVLRNHGLAHRFRTEQLDNGKIKVTCIITGHGHREENSLQSDPDTGPGRNSHQAIASTVTYLERYTLKAALGLAAGHDDDGRGGGGPITEEQVKEIIAKCDELGEGNKEALCEMLSEGGPKVEGIAMIPASQYQRAIDAIAKKKRILGIKP